MASMIPNVLTVFRLACAPLVLVSAALSGAHFGWAIVAFVAFTAAAVTDMLDGALARALKAHSAWGETWDPIADKALVACALIGLALSGAIGGWLLLAGAAIVARDAWVTWMRRAAPIKVSWLAKIKTFVEMLALFVLLLGPAITAWLISAPQRGYWSFMGQTPVLIAGQTLLVAAAVLSVWTALAYRRGAAKPAG